jgi:hypothetical protein
MFWRKTLIRFAESGLTQAEFCRQESINISNICWWKREIAARDAQDKKDNTKKHEGEQRLVYWRKMVAKFNTSGLSKDDFCTREGIKPSAFCWWRAELIRRNTKKSQEFARPLQAGSEIFVPLLPANPRPVRQVSREPHAIAEIDIAIGMIRIFETDNTDNLLALLKVIRELVV